MSPIIRKRPVTLEVSPPMGSPPKKVIPINSMCLNNSRAK